MNYDEMRAMEETHACAECGMPLVTIWNKDKEDYQLVCGTDRSHRGYQKILSDSKALAQGKMDEVAGKGAQKDLEKLAAEGRAELSRLPIADLATNKPLGEVALRNLVNWGADLGLKPYLGHICLYFSKPYVTVDGYYYLNNKREKPYSISTRPMTTEERKDYKLSKDDHGYIAEARDRDGVVVANGIGLATKDEIEAKSERAPEQFRAPVVHEHPQRMAEKRAEWQVLRKVIPLEEKETS